MVHTSGEMILPSPHLTSETPKLGVVGQLALEPIYQFPGARNSRFRLLRTQERLRGEEGVELQGSSQHDMAFSGGG